MTMRAEAGVLGTLNRLARLPGKPGHLARYLSIIWPMA